MKQHPGDLIPLRLYLNLAKQPDCWDSTSETVLIHPANLQQSAFLMEDFYLSQPPSLCSYFTDAWNGISCSFLLALCAGCWSVALVDLVPDAGTQGVIAVGGQQSSRSGQKAEVAVEDITLLDAILQEKTVAQSVVAHCVFHLREDKKNLQCGQKENTKNSIRSETFNILKRFLSVEAVVLWHAEHTWLQKWYFNFTPVLTWTSKLDSFQTRFFPQKKVIHMISESHGPQEKHAALKQCYPKHRLIPFPRPGEEERFQPYSRKDKSWPVHFLRRQGEYLAHTHAQSLSFAVHVLACARESYDFTYIVRKTYRIKAEETNYIRFFFLQWRAPRRRRFVPLAQSLVVHHYLHKCFC